MSKLLLRQEVINTVLYTWEDFRDFFIISLFLFYLEWFKVPEHLLCLYIRIWNSRVPRASHQKLYVKINITTKYNPSTKGNWCLICNFKSIVIKWNVKLLTLTGASHLTEHLKFQGQIWFICLQCSFWTLKIWMHWADWRIMASVFVCLLRWLKPCRGGSF